MFSLTSNKIWTVCTDVKRFRDKVPGNNNDLNESNTRWGPFLTDNARVVVSLLLSTINH